MVLRQLVKQARIWLSVAKDRVSDLKLENINQIVPKKLLKHASKTDTCGIMRQCAGKA